MWESIPPCSLRSRASFRPFGLPTFDPDTGSNAVRPSELPPARPTPGASRSRPPGACFYRLLHVLKRIHFSLERLIRLRFKTSSIRAGSLRLLQ